MLTQQDLAAIGNLIDQKLDQKLDEKLKPITLELKDLRTDLNNLRRDVNLIVKFFDNEVISIHKRVSRLKDYLHLHSS